MMRPHPIRLITLLLLMLIIGVSACAGLGDSAQETLTLAPESALPDFARGAPPQIREAYRFAIANPEVLRQYPCYCGCGAMGHQDNLGCYIKEFRADGSIEFENHAFG